MPLRYQAIGEALRHTIAARPDADALVVPHQGVRWSWRSLGERVDRVAVGLLALGLEPGDRVGMWGPNSAEWVLVQLACARAGFILVTINPAYRRDELVHALELTGVRALVLADRFKSSDYVAMLLDAVPRFGGADQGSDGPCSELRFAIGLGRTVGDIIPFERLLEEPDSAPFAHLETISREVGPDDAACIQFTSGTTGAPKGATLSHFGLLNNGALTGSVMRMRPEDRVCIPVPLFHCFGMVVGVLGCVAHGSTMVLPSESFDPAAVMASVERERCTVLYGVPTMFIAELALPDFGRFDISSLRTGAMGGAPCPEDVMRRVCVDMEMREVTIAFGMTETSPVSFQTRTDADLETRTATIGTAHPWVEARIADETGRPVSRGKIGELQIRGYGVMLGYWNDPQRTAETIINGWLRTGDLAAMDDQGRCRIVGRSKDMIIRGGENIYPVELENFLRTHPAIVDVAVFGVPDARLGEEVCAWIKTSGPLSAEHILAHCAGRLAHYKIPSHVRFVDGFPMTASGKMYKPGMRKAEERDPTPRIPVARGSERAIKERLSR
ncbi:AMP-binding protein [Sphingobium sp.]|uniref:AMP-binding protein n=1 Tax=Sphingobium sp. TaxID=1912891 RepID=UPI0028BEB010|nr:AMP-binding protein [Sphingobium sp.]